jgi:hypothetical protein
LRRVGIAANNDEERKEKEAEGRLDIGGEAIVPKGLED